MSNISEEDRLGSCKIKSTMYTKEFGQDSGACMPRGYIEQPNYAESEAVTHLHAAEVGHRVGGCADGSLQIVASTTVLHDGSHGGEQAAVRDPARLALQRPDEAVRHGAHRCIRIRHLHVDRCPSSMHICKAEIHCKKIQTS